MYVCVCKAVTEGQVAEAIKRGCCNKAGLQKKLGVGTVCGKCVPMAKQMLKEKTV
jgi:bacterioferritin-associated ferredoxin